MIFVTNGPPGSGKDAASEYLVEIYGFKHMTFKYELFKQTFVHYGVSEEWFMEGYNDRTKKELPEELLGGKSKRQALIHVAEDIIKPTYGSDYFGQQAASNIKLPGQYCFSDSGFSTELQPLINKFGTEKVCLIQILRDGCDYSKDSRNYLHGKLCEEYVNGHKTTYDFGPQIRAIRDTFGSKVNVQKVVSCRLSLSPPLQGGGRGRGGSGRSRSSHRATLRGDCQNKPRD